MYLTYYVTLAEWKVKMDSNSCNVFVRSLKANELGIPACCYVQCLKMFDPEVLQFLITVADLSFVDAMCQNNSRKLLYTSTNLCFTNRLNHRRSVSEQFCLFLLLYQKISFLKDFIH